MDDAYAVKCFEKGSAEGGLWPHSKLGEAYYEGWGVQQDYAKAVQHLQQGQGQRPTATIRTEQKDREQGGASRLCGTAALLAVPLHKFPYLRTGNGLMGIFKNDLLIFRGSGAALVFEGF